MQLKKDNIKFKNVIKNKWENNKILKGSTAW